MPHFIDNFNFHGVITRFLGGHFGYVRASVGPFWGYVAGVMGLIESIYFLAVSMLKLGQACTTTFATDRQFELLWWTISYISLMIVYVRGGMTLWNFLGVIAVITISTMVIYLFGSTPALDVPKYGYSNSDNGFTGDAIDFFLVMRLPCWLFVGIDLLPLTAEEVHEVL